MKKLYDYLEYRSDQPNLHIMDNEALVETKNMLTKREVRYQLVETHIHQTNATERTLHTFKNQFIAGLCTTDKIFPLQLWDRLLSQATFNLNLLRRSRIKPKVFTEAQLNVNFDFNATPLAPPGTKAVVLYDPQTRGTWETHGTNSW